MTATLLHFMASIQQMGVLGAIILVLVYALACVTLLPGSLLTLGAGAVYGLVAGSLLISVGSLLGSALSFLASRYVLRDWMLRRLSQNKKFIQLDAAVAQEGWKIVLLSRLSPIFPFSVINYGLGLTRISLWHFLGASWLGTLPLIVAYVYAGKVAGSVLALGKGQPHPAGFWILQILGWIATVVLCVVLTRLATRLLQSKIE